MIIKHDGLSPIINQTTYVAPNAVICGDVVIGRNCRIMFGAEIIAENSRIEIGDNCIILENAVIRGAKDYSVKIGDNCLIGPHAHIVGAYIEDNVFIATGASIFHAARLMKGSEVQINGVVHIKTKLDENSVVPIGWIAVGNPARIFPPNNHEEIWEIQQSLQFSKTVYGVNRPDNGEPNSMQSICMEMSKRLKSYFEDEVD